jgi:gliding motility-associated-like protein
MRLLIAIVFSLSCVVVSAQSGPFIESVSPAVTYPGDTIVITGTGFPPAVNKTQVWFGQVRGNVVSVTDFSIQVAVPASARYGVIEVLDTDTKLSAKSEIRFHPYFSGNAFDASLMKLGTSVTSTEMLYDLCSCDLDTDGKPDVAATRFDKSTNLLVMKNGSVPGALSFTSQNVNASVFTEEITCGDLNGDGKPELVASRSGGSSGGQRNAVFILPNTSSAGTISFGTAIGRYFTSGLEGVARFVTIRDLNLDGKPEIIVSNSFSNNLYIFVNESTNGTLNIKEAPVVVTVPGISSSYGIEIQDLDGDRRPEIVFNQFQLGGLYIAKNLSGSEIAFAQPQALTGVGFNGAYNKLVAADFNLDGQMDFASSDWTSSKIWVWINKTNGASTFSFTSMPLLDADVKPDGMDVGDIDGDKDIDIVVASRGSNFINVFVNTIDMDADPVVPLGFSTKKQISAGKNQRNIILADLDGDSKPEVGVVASNVSNQHSLDIYRNANCFIATVLTEPASICPGQDFLLESIPNYGATFTWKQDGSTKTTGLGKWNYTTTVAGGYTVSASSESNSCNSTSSSVTLAPGTGAVPPNPELSTSGTVVCAGKNLTLTAKSLSGASYVWTGPDNYSNTTSTNSVIIAGVTKENAGEYSVQITQGFCKSDVDKLIVGVANVDGFTVTSSSSTNSVCAGSPLTLSTALVDGYSYQWKKGTSNASSTTSSLSVTESASYSVVVSSTTASSCSKESPPVTVKVLSAPVAKWSTTGSLCKNSEVTFTSTSTLDSQGTPVYAWTFGDNGKSSTSPAKHTYATSKTFTATLTVSYSGVVGCTDTESKDLVVTDGSTPAISSTTNEICPDDEIALNVTGGNFSSFNWSPSGTGNPLIVTTGGVYTVTTTDVNGCTAKASFTMTNKPVPDVSVSPGDTLVPIGLPLQFRVTGGETYSWEPAAAFEDPTIANPVANPLTSTTYTVVVSTAGQCDVTRNINVVVEGSLEIPNVFTPNNDGNNDLWWIPGGAAMPDCMVTIFSQNGSRILEEYANNLDWDGTYNGKPVPQGVYYYVLNCPGATPITGNILVAR